MNRRQVALYLTITVCSAFFCLLFAGADALVTSAQEAARQTLNLIPRIALGLIIAGLVAVLLPTAIVAVWLGSASGLKGIAIATALGSVMPGGPMTAFPLVVGLMAAGADVGALVAFLTSWGILSLQRMLVWEVPFFGADFALIRYAICLPLPVVSGLLARWLSQRIALFRSPEQE